MKIDANNIFKLYDNLKGIEAGARPSSLQGSKPQKTFSIPRSGELTKSRSAVQEESVKVSKNITKGGAGKDLQKLLSTEEKRLFEQLFPSNPSKNLRINRIERSAGPVKAYALQQHHNVQSVSAIPKGRDVQPGGTHNKFIGNNLDIKG